MRFIDASSLMILANFGRLDLIDAKELWKTMLEEARMMQTLEPSLRDFLEARILKKPNFADALAKNLSSHFFQHR